MKRRLGFLAATVAVVASKTRGIHAVDTTTERNVETTIQGRQQIIAEPHPPILCWGESSQTSFDMFDGTRAMAPPEILDQLSASSCGLCDPRKAIRVPTKPSSSADDIDERYHALLVFPDNAPEFIPLATGLLLTNQFRITLLRLHFESDDPKAPRSRFDKRTGRVLEEMRQELHDSIMTGIPCDHPIRTVADASYFLEVNFSIKEQNRFNSHSGDPSSTCQGPVGQKPFDICTIQAGPGTALLIKNYVPSSNPAKSPIGSSLPDVLITDASLIGSMWMAEAWKIPAVVVASPDFVPLVVEHDAAWTTRNGSLWKRLVNMVRQRFHSLSITKGYMTMNKMRTDFGLERFRRPIDYFAPVAAILMEFSPENSIPGVDSDKAQASFVETTEHWERIHVVGPLQPPCAPCQPQSQSHLSKLRRACRDKQSSSKQKKPPTILVVEPVAQTPLYIRTILQGLVMAQQSLNEYDDCDWDSLSCQKPYNNFKIVWLADEDLPDYYLPPIRIESVEIEPYINIFDSLSRHPNTVLALMRCDRTSAVLEKSLGIPFICLEETERFPLRPEQLPPNPMDPRDLAARILYQLRTLQLKEQRTPSKSSSSDSGTASARTAQGSLKRSVSIIEHVARAHRENYPWTSADQMQRISRQAVENLTRQPADIANSSTNAPQEDDFDWQPPYDTFTVLVAWLVLLASMSYVAVKDVLVSRSIRRSHNPYNLRIPSSSADGLFTRPDLDYAWAAWVEWYEEQPDSLGPLYQSIVGNDVTSSSPSYHSPQRHGASSPTKDVKKRKKR